MLIFPIAKGREQPRRPSVGDPVKKGRYVYHGVPALERRRPVACYSLADVLRETRHKRQTLHDSTFLRDLK